MPIAPPVPQPAPAPRAHLLFCGAVCLGAAACFAIPGALLLGGTLYLPLFIISVIGQPLENPLWYLVAMIVLGWGGFAAVVRILVLLCRNRRDARRTATLLGLACGIASALLHGLTIWIGRVPARYEVSIIDVPIACALHLVYLARRILFAKPPATAVTRLLILGLAIATTGCAYALGPGAPLDPRFDRDYLRVLERGMSLDQVRNALGEPHARSGAADTPIWRYEHTRQLRGCSTTFLGMTVSPRPSERREIELRFGQSSLESATLVERTSERTTRVDLLRRPPG